VKPGDHPEFFRFPAPEGASRESTIRLDAEGRFFHEGEPVVHPGLAAAMYTWIRRHPDNRRFILSNGYDWTYFTVEDAPFFVRSIHEKDGRIALTLSDATHEEWDPARSRLGPDGGLYAEVKRALPGGPFDAKFTRHAQSALAPFLVEQADRPAVRVGGKVVVIGEP
jgi:uncharacterized protein